MSNYQLFNGNFFQANEPIIPSSNRGLCYGDGFFESLRVSNGKAPFITAHWQRLQRVCAFLQIQIPEELTLQIFNRHVLALAAKNGYSNARIRFQGFREGSGRYAPDKSDLGWVMVCQPLEESQYVMNKKGLHLDVCDSHKINPAPQSSFKTSNSLPYVLGGMYAQKNGLDDCFLVDANGFIAEATGSNVFLAKGNELVTPDLSNGGVGGVMRSVLIQEAKACGLDVTTALVSKEDILQADECFLTNASRGIQWVGAVGKKRYFKKLAEKLTLHINQKYGLLS